MLDKFFQQQLICCHHHKLKTLCTRGELKDVLKMSKDCRTFFSFDKPATKILEKSIDLGIAAKKTGVKYSL